MRSNESIIEEIGRLKKELASNKTSGKRVVLEWVQPSEYDNPLKTYEVDLFHGQRLPPLPGGTEIEEDIDLEKYHYIKVYIYTHGGTTLSSTPFSCKWDSGFLGFLAISKEEDWLDNPTEYLEEILKEYNYFLNNNYYLVLYYENGELIDEENYFGHPTEILKKLIEEDIKGEWSEVLKDTRVKEDY